MKRIGERQLVLQTLAAPRDVNTMGDIFGGWLLSQMDIAGAICARRVAQNRVVTRAVSEMEFIKPVFVGDLVLSYATCLKLGRSSATVAVEVEVLRGLDERQLDVAKGCFIYVSLNKEGQPLPIKPH